MATTNPLLQQIDAIAKEKGVEPDIIINAVQDALEAAARKRYKSEALRARFNTDSGQLELYAVKKIVAEVTDPSTQISLEEAQQLYGDEAEVDMEIEFPRPTEDLGRIAAQTAKQVIFQKVREAERENVYAEYSNRVGEVVSGIVKRFENGDIIVELGRVESQLPRKEQSRAENYTVGDRVRAVIRGVNRSAKGPQIVLSRTDPALLIKLFEQEVPEIYDGTVMIRGAVREAGDRAKVAVYSRERDVDPVGACVGMKGTRVQSIIRELRGEKIDIVEWSEDPIVFVTNAISPAKVQRVSIVDDAEKVMEVVVEDKQLSLAIGKKGQNVRLASQLTGWRIDIHAESKVKELEEHARRSMAEIEGSSDELAGTLFKLGWRSAEEVARARVEELGGVPGVGGEQGAERLKIAAAKQVEVEKQRKAAAIEAERQAAEAAKLAAAEAAANPVLTEPNAVDAGWTEGTKKE